MDVYCVISKTIHIAMQFGELAILQNFVLLLLNNNSLLFAKRSLLRLEFQVS